MPYMAPKVNSLRVRRALESMGFNIKTARIKRRISIEDFAERIGVSKRTVIRLEKGDEGVSVGTLAICASKLQHYGRCMTAAQQHTKLAERFIELSDKCHKQINSNAKAWWSDEVRV